MRAQRGDDAAYGQLVDRHAAVAFRTAYVLAGSAADAEEAAQDAFVKAYRALGRFRAGAPWRPWLLRIVANEARNRRRAAGRRARVELPRGGGPGGRAGGAVVRGAGARGRARRRPARGARRARRPRPRGARTCASSSTCGEAEMAAVLGCRPGTVKSRVSRALGRLRERAGGARCRLTLEARLRALGAEADFPPTPPALAAAVRARVAAEGAPRAPAPGAPSARHRARRARRRAGRRGGRDPRRARRRARVARPARRRGPHRPRGPAGGAARDRLGRRARAPLVARRRPRRRPLPRPRARGPRRARTASTSAGPPGGRVSLVYDRPRGPLLVTQVRGRRPFVEKLAGPGTTIEPVRVGGRRGRLDHRRAARPVLRGRARAIRQDTARVAGNVLFWERDGVAAAPGGRRLARRGAAYRPVVPLERALQVVEPHEPAARVDDDADRVEAQLEAVRAVGDLGAGTRRPCGGPGSACARRARPTGCPGRRGGS